MKWLLDTNVVSETGKRRPNPMVIEWLAAQAPHQLAVSVVTIAELHSGALAITEVGRRGELLQWIGTSKWIAESSLALSLEIVIDWLQMARLLAAKRITRQAPDLLIAATARVHNLIVVTRNVRDFAETGVRVYDPWNDRSLVMDAP